MRPLPEHTLNDAARDDMVERLCPALVRAAKRPAPYDGSRIAVSTYPQLIAPRRAEERSLVTVEREGDRVVLTLSPRGRLPERRPRLQPKRASSSSRPIPCRGRS
jgi:hypothetical protein